MKPISTLLIAVALLARAPVPCSAQNLTDSDRTAMLERIASTLADKAYDPAGKLKEWPKLMEEYGPKLAEAKDDAAFLGLLREALASTKVSHLQILTPDTMKYLVTQKLVGIGAYGGRVGGEIVVTELAPGSPADECGVEIGDTIMSVNDERPTNAGLFAEAGTIVGIQYRKPDGSIHRRRARVRSFEYRPPDAFYAVTPRTAYVRVRSFMDGAYSTTWVRNTMRDAVKFENLIVDLRDNGGGTLSYLADLCSYFVRPGTSLGLFITKKGLDMAEAQPYTPSAKSLSAFQDLAAIEKAGRLELFSPKPAYGPFRGKLILMVNGGSGSAAEIAAGALVEAGRPLAVIGMPSAGAVLASKSEPIGKSYMLQYPAADYLTPLGVRLEANPVQPTHRVTDLEVAMALQRGERDPAIALALKLFGDPGR
ncbi:MAG: hypothetical protein AMXMBFR61_10300 [Fimbriimonadales bacterium]